MGCDTHMHIERLEGETWKSLDTWVEDEDGDIRVKDVFYDTRNYDLFAILADVRNDGLEPLCSPLGLPTDVSPEVQKASDSWGGDGHSHSWHTVQELLDYDWTRIAEKSGFVDAVTWERWRRRQQWVAAPEEYSGGVSGGRVQIISVDEMDRRIQEVCAHTSTHAELVHRLENDMRSVYAEARWSEPYHDRCRTWWSSAMPRLLRLGPPNSVRIVFWFDN